MAVFHTADGCALFHRVLGAGAAGLPLVLVNGTAQTTRNWLPLAARLKARGPVVLYDGRAQGQSRGGGRPLNLETHAADLLALLDHLGLARVRLAGLSHGARVALAAARRRPERVAGLVLASIGAGRSPRARAALRCWRQVLAAGGLEALAWAMLPLIFGPRFLGAHRGGLPQLVAALVARNEAAQMARFLASQEHYAPVEDLLPGAGIPALVAAGADDLLLAPEGPERLANLLGGRCRRLAGVGHSLAAEAPDDFLELLHDFPGQP